MGVFFSLSTPRFPPGLLDWRSCYCLSLKLSWSLSWRSCWKRRHVDSSALGRGRTARCYPCWMCWWWRHSGQACRVGTGYVGSRWRSDAWRSCNMWWWWFHPRQKSSYAWSWVPASSLSLLPSVISILCHCKWGQDLSVHVSVFLQRLPLLEPTCSLLCRRGQCVTWGVIECQSLTFWCERTKTFFPHCPVSPIVCATVWLRARLGFGRELGLCSSFVLWAKSPFGNATIIILLFPFVWA